MNLNPGEKEIRILKVVSQISGGFTLLVAITMLFTLIQLKLINPLDSPALLSVKEQYDREPSNAAKAEQVRAMDLMARRAYFSARWQVETGSYLLLAGALIFVLSQRLIAGSEKVSPAFPKAKQDTLLLKERNRKYLLAAAVAVCFLAIGASLVLRTELPDTSGRTADSESQGRKGKTDIPEPDKTNFPFFRGQNGNGIAGGKGYPTDWDGATGKNVAWAVEIPGGGKSSPVIWENKLFLTSAEDNSCNVICIDKETGKTLWTGSASNIQGEPQEVPRMDAEAGLAVSTVATNGTSVCAVFANGNLICFDPDGKQKWAKNIGLPETSYGYSSSLIIFDNTLIVQFDSNSKISLLGFDIDTGTLKWETPRQGRAVWSSPVLGYFNKTPQVIINGNPRVSGFNAVDGKEIWSVETMTGDVAPSVAVNSEMVYAVTDYAVLAAIKPGAGATVAWSDNTFTPDVSSPVATDEFLYVATGNGDVACYNAAKGDTLWTHYFSDQFYASPIVADEKVYLLDRSGEMHIVELGNAYKLVSEPALGDETDCTPAFSDKKIYIRSRTKLYCISNN